MIPFVGGSYELARKKSDTQRTINMCPTPIESGSGKSALYLQSIPGLTAFSEAPAPAPPPPPICPGGFLEDFETGSTHYSITGGGIFIFNTVDTYGASLSIMGGVSTAFGSTAYRDIASTGITSVDFKVRIDTLLTTGLPDDGPILRLQQGTSVDNILFDPAREKFFDATQRPYVQANAGTATPIGSTSLALHNWYAVRYEITSPTTCEVTIKDAVSLALFGSATLSGSFTPWTMDRIHFENSFSFGSNDSNPGCTYDEILLC